MSQQTLDWPEGLERTPPDDRAAVLGTSDPVQKIARDILVALDLMGVDPDAADLRTGMRHQDRDPNVPAMGSATPMDPGVVLEFRVDNAEVVIASDETRSVKQNLAAVRDHVEHIQTAFGDDATSDHFNNNPGPSGRF